VLEVDMTAGFCVAGFRVVIQFVSAQQHVGSFHSDIPSKMPDRPYSVLRDGFNMDVFRIGGAGADRINLLIGIRAERRRSARWG
jgi:hypothetical protein